MTCSSTEAEVQWVSKDPDDKLDYGTSWVKRLAEDETIATSEWLIEVPAGDTTPLAIAPSPAPSIVDGVTYVWLTGGTLGTEYTVVNRITTDQGRIQDRTKFVNIEQH